MTLARLAASGLEIERESIRAEAAYARLRGACQQRAHRSPETNISGWTRTWRLADGSLVDFEHPVELVDAGDGSATGRYRGSLPLASSGQQLRDIVTQDVAYQRTFATAANTRDADQPAQWQCRLDPFQVVQSGALDDQLRVVAFDRASGA